MKNVPFFTGLIMVLCGVACWLGAGNKQATPVIDNLEAIEVPPQALQAYKFQIVYEAFIRPTMALVFFSMLLITLALIIEWCNAQLAKKKEAEHLLEIQMKERTTQQIQQEVSKWSHEDVVTPIRKAKDYDIAWGLLKSVSMQGHKLMIDCFKHGEKYPDHFGNSQNIFLLKAGYYYSLEKVSKQMKKARAAFNKNMSVHIFFLEGWCRLHIQPRKLNQMDKHILVMIYDHIQAPKLSLITSGVYTAPYCFGYEFESDSSIYKSLYVPAKR